MKNHATILTPSSLDDIPLIQTIARSTWPNTFANILSGKQINYMLERMYSTKTLSELMNHPNFRFYMINKDGGMTAIELHYEGHAVSKLHKIYILPIHQGKGLGKKAIDELEDISRNGGDLAMILNVNKQNPAKHFYEKCGFTRWKSEVIDIGHGYVMDDYVYRKWY